jgi:hypothetical protein
MLTEKEYGSIDEVEEFVTQLEQAWRDLAEFDSLTAELVSKAPSPKSDEQPAQARTN